MDADAQYRNYKIQEYVQRGTANLTPQEFADFQRLLDIEGEAQKQRPSPFNEQLTGANFLAPKKTFWSFCNDHPGIVGFFIFLVLPYIIVMWFNIGAQSRYGDPAVKAMANVAMRYNKTLVQEPSGKWVLK